MGFQANTSAKSPEDLDGIEELESEDPEIFGRLMLEVYEKYRMPILGGCCGTDPPGCARVGPTESTGQAG